MEASLLDESTNGQLQEAENSTGDSDELFNWFDKLPQEMVTAVLERLADSQDTLLACRQVSSHFRLLVDEMLEKQHISLWSWSKSYGEGKPTTIPGPIKRPPASGKLFKEPADIDSFLVHMSEHEDLALNPFPNRGVYFRRVLQNPPFPPAVAINNPEENGGDADEDFSVNQMRMRSLRFLGREPGPGGDEPNQVNPRILSIPKINHLLERFGDHVTSLILECRVILDLGSIQELASVLENVPNLRCLMLKGVRVDKMTTEEFLPLPNLDNLTSIKVIQCNGLIGPILNSYHGQLKTLQVLNHRDYWFPHFDKLQRDNNGVIFDKLKELKLGEFDNPAEFDYLSSFLKSQQEMGRPLHKLERLSIHHSMINAFDKPAEKLLQVLEYLPKLREYNVGKCAGGAGFNVDPAEERAPLKLIIGSPQLTRLSLPVQFIRYPFLLRKMFQKIRSLEQVRFLECDRLLWDFENVAVAQVLQLPEDTTLPGILQDLLEMGEETSGLEKISVVTCFGNEERIVCAARKKMRTT